MCPEQEVLHNGQVTLKIIFGVFPHFSGEEDGYTRCTRDPPVGQPG